jgi:hypothetical protein
VLPLEPAATGVGLLVPNLRACDRAVARKRFEVVVRVALRAWLRRLTELWRALWDVAGAAR